MKATIKDIAARAHVSTATVSRVLAEKKKAYRPETAAKIKAIAKELGYTKNLAAAELAAKNSKLIAVILNNTQTNFSNEILAAIQTVTDKAGYQMFILYAGDNDHRLLNQAIHTALERSVAGILLVATPLDEHAATTLREANVPCRLVSIYDQETPCYADFKFISSNNIKAGELATNYLLTRGHKRIGLIGIDRSAIGLQRLAGYKKALKAHNIGFDPSLVQYGDYSYNAEDNILSSFIKKAPDALIAASDMIGVGLIKEARQLDIQVPTELSIISIDGTFLCDITSPTITSVTQNFYQMGLAAANDLLNDRDSQFIPIKITERASVTNKNEESGLWYNR